MPLNVTLVDSPGSLTIIAMQQPNDDIENARGMPIICAAPFELTELGLALRQAVLQQDDSDGDALAEVMRDIRRAKEQAWRQSPS